MTKVRECIRGCGYPATATKRRCRWHILLEDTPMDEQIEAARRRERRWEASGAERRARVPSSEWPPGERWCSGCQGYVPLFYCSGSRCKAHNSLSAHSASIEKTYGITREDYEALLDLQGGACFICGKKPKGKRLAVDHDHKTGEVRGLLCTNDQFGCNLAIVGNLEAAPIGALAAAANLVAYLEDPPYRRLKEMASHGRNEDDDWIPDDW